MANDPDDAARAVLREHLLTGAFATQIDRIEAHRVVLRPGQRASNHIHSGGVVGYVVDGEITFQVEGQPTTTSRGGSAFFEPPGASGAGDLGVEGVLLAQHDGSGARVFSHAAAAGAPYFWVEWNLAAGAPDSQPGTVSTANGQNLFPAALSYSWSSDGALTPQTPVLPGAPAMQTPPLASIGNPTGGSSFTTWQRMTLDITAYQASPTSHSEVIPGVYAARVDYVAWSPDGHYLALMAYVGLLEPNGPPVLTSAEAKALTPSQYPILPIRDKALAAALALVSTDPNHSIPVSITWKPDGRQLAVTSVNVDPNGNVVPASYRVLLFDCATGAKLATLTPDSISEAVRDDNNTYLAWSPDGKRLLLADGHLGTITFWSGAALP
ncbi:MAG: cupin domain-containing protein [Ktedonobacterales bacterium]